MAGAGARSAARPTRPAISGPTMRVRWYSRPRRSTADIEILGAAIVTLDVACDRSLANLAVRLCDVHPDGASLRVSYGILNLAHRDGSETPAPLVPRRRYRVRIQLNDAGAVFPAGHRIRLALSTAYWPMVWPSRENATVTVFGGTLDLPVRPPNAADALLPSLPEPETALARADHGRASGGGTDRPDRPRTGHGGKLRMPHRGGRSTQRGRRNAPRRRRSRAMRGGRGSRPGCGCRARMMRSCCGRRCRRGKATCRSVVANGTTAFRANSYSAALRPAR